MNLRKTAKKSNEENKVDLEELENNMKNINLIKSNQEEEEDELEREIIEERNHKNKLLMNKSDDTIQNEEDGEYNDNEDLVSYDSDDEQLIQLVIYFISSS
jgi:hypothetical protein